MQLPLALAPITSYASWGLASFNTILLAAMSGFIFVVKLMVHLFPMKSTNIPMQTLNIELSHSQGKAVKHLF